jgi:hypothetical protein
MSQLRAVAWTGPGAVRIRQARALAVTQEKNLGMVKLMSFKKIDYAMQRQ